jgi:hypothetical protein
VGPALAVVDARFRFDPFRSGFSSGIAGAFRWLSLLRTWMISLPLLALHHYLLAMLAPPIHSAPTEQVAIFLKSIGIRLTFLAFLIPAWLGCRSPRPASVLAKE